MSKSGVHKHFGTKETLQISTLDKAFVDFWHRVVEPALAEPPGLRRLRAVCANSVGYLEAPLLPGGCLMTAALTEYDGRPGRVRDAVAEVWSHWREQLRADLAAAMENGELPAGFDIDQALFEIVAAGLALNAAMQRTPDRALAEHAKRMPTQRRSSRPHRLRHPGYDRLTAFLLVSPSVQRMKSMPSVGCTSLRWRPRASALRMPVPMSTSTRSAMSGSAVGE